jgi:hypothetical protein
MNASRPITNFAIAALALAAAAACAQFISNSPRQQSAEKNAAVEYLYPEQLRLAVGKPSQVALHFRVAPGLHINSHTPGADYLIPTTFSIPQGSGVRLVDSAYPPGVNITLPADPTTKLNVYTGDFAIQARVAATPGDHLVKGRLHYQACDQTQCMPPRTITVAIDVIGK